ncbi:MAG TPA: hypothetical protein VGI30_14890 [Caulobacteraceae bacterium]|jgi:hypothetical protein
MPRARPKATAKAPWAERLFVSASTLTFTALMAAVVAGLQLGRF